MLVHRLRRAARHCGENQGIPRGITSSLADDEGAGDSFIKCGKFRPMRFGQ